MPVNDNSIKRKRLKLQNTDENKSVYIRFSSPTKFEYAIGRDTKSVENIVEVELN